ncbi:MAG: GHMP kinase [Spirochaetales bacterium]|nr:GHMP kinase [Spirochaetales bacterium]
MKTVTAFSPGHITGFFYIHDTGRSPLHSGSLGAGFSLEKGVTTMLTVETAPERTIDIIINGIPAGNAAVSERVIDLFFDLTGTDDSCRIKVDHTIDLPIGAGCGTSGAGALSLALSLDEAFGTGLSRIEAAGLAHRAEVEMKTGLGTVIGETFGGIEIRIAPGAPGTGRMLQIPPDRRYKAVALILGGLETKELLRQKKTRRAVNRYGKKLIKQLVKDPTVPAFLRLSRHFTEKTGLADATTHHILRVLDDEGITAGMPMFGRGVFTIVGEDAAEKVRHLLFTCTGSKNSIVCDIDYQGARVLDGN